LLDPLKGKPVDNRLRFEDHFHPDEFKFPGLVVAEMGLAELMP